MRRSPSVHNECGQATVIAVCPKISSLCPCPGLPKDWDPQDLERRTAYFQQVLADEVHVRRTRRSNRHFHQAEFLGVDLRHQIQTGKQVRLDLEGSISITWLQRQGQRLGRTLAAHDSICVSN